MTALPRHEHYDANRIGQNGKFIFFEQFNKPKRGIFVLLDCYPSKTISTQISWILPQKASNFNSNRIWASEFTILPIIVLSPPLPLTIRKQSRMFNFEFTSASTQTKDLFVPQVRRAIWRRYFWRESHYRRFSNNSQHILKIIREWYLNITSYYSPTIWIWNLSTKDCVRAKTP